MQSLDTFRCSDDKHTLDIFSTMLFDIIYCCNSGSTGCKHRIYDNDKTLVNRIRQFAVILMRLMGLRIAVQTDVSDLRRRNQCSHTIYHTKSCTKYRYDGKLFAGDHRAHACLNRCLNLHILDRQIAKCLISHQHCDFLDQFTKLICSCMFVPDH